jgi:Dolichyl-phosphate-mannose-protein mannosyltransferase
VRRNWLVSLATLLAIVGLIWGVRAGALWDPHEVTVAELARRIGLNLLGGSRLAVAGADNSLPIRADLGRGELPFTSAALGFRLFGLSDWAGRLPLALWSLVGLASLRAALGRLWDRRVALYATLVLSTTPLYFLQARVLLGDAVTLATGAMAWSGFAVACLAAEVSGRARAGFALLGAVGLYAGFWCRGPIVSVAVPALAVGVAALLGRPPGRLARWLALAVSVVGALALALGCSGLSLAQQTGDYSVFVGSALAHAPEPTTFDATLGNLAHAAFPWSAAAPLALALVLKRGDDSSPRRMAINAAALGLGLSLAASAWLSAWFGGSVPPAVGCFAALLAVALSELETGDLGSPLLGLVVAATGVVIGLDLREYPDKTLVGLGLAGVSLPESLRSASASLWLGAALVVAVTSVACLYESEARAASDEPAPAFHRTEYARVLSTLQTLWDGNLVFALLVLEAALVGFLLLSAVSERLVPLPQLDGFGSLTRRLVAVAAICVPLVPLLPLGALFLRDIARALFGEHSRGRWRVLAPSRAQGLLLTFAVLGGVASLGFYPAVARQLSPREALERYRQLRRPGELLGIVGESRESARYQGASDAVSLEGVDSAFAWLATDAEGARRWLVIRKGELPELNAQFRSLTHQNLPVLDARSSELLLASNRRLPSERDENPFADSVRSDAPAVQHPLHAVLDDKLEVLGWSVRDQAGQLATSVVPATTYRFAIYYRVLAPLSGAWQTFVHIDGLQRRYNADHDPLDGKYPLRFWRQSDVIVDTTDVLLEPNFSPGAYRVYFGLFSGEHRLPVRQGNQKRETGDTGASDDRIVAGTLQVR